MKRLTQSKFVKGLIATTTDQSQPKGSLPRLSNMLFSRRGGLETCDGSKIVSGPSAAALNIGPWTELFLFQPVNISRYYIGLRKDNQLGIPANVQAVDNGAGGTLNNNIYRYIITALDGGGGETTGSAEVSVTPAFHHLVLVTWNAVASAQAYNVYRTVGNGAAGTETLLTTATSPTFTDDGTFTPGTQAPPNFNTTQLVTLVHIHAPTYDRAADIITTFPADAIVAVDGTPGGEGGGGGGGGTTPTSGNPPTPAGGNTGNTSPLPQIVQFIGKAFIALGNGFAPKIFTDPSTVAAITNTFTATYPDWQTATIYSIGDIIKPTANNVGGFVFKAIQGGTSGGAAPVFPQTKDQQINDNKIIWQNIGLGSTAPAPRGAAHVTVYAGSVWVLNTSPTTTTDNLDGPNCLKMSDLNNPTSWNPLNVAFLSKDDGDQGTGLLAFTIADVGIASTSALFAFKNFKTFQIIGVFGASDFQILEVQTDMGCIAPRSISFVPGFGGMRLTHLGIAVLDGIRDKLISEDIRPYLFADPLVSDILPMDWNYAYFSKAAQSADPPMYMLAVPVALNAIGVGAPTLAAVAGASTWTAGTYFFRLTKFTIINGLLTESAMSLELSVTLDTTHQLRITPAVAQDANTVKWRLYVGLTTGSYTNFIEQPSFASVQNITAFATFTQSGLPVAGLGGLTRLLCYDLVFKCWAVIDLPFAISVLKQVRAPGTQPITIIGLFSDGTMRRLQAGDNDWDGVAIQWRMKTPKVYGDGATRRVFYRSVNLRGSGSTTSLTIEPEYNNTPAANAPLVVYPLGGSQFHATADLFNTALDADVIVSGVGRTEIDSVDWSVEPLTEDVPMVMG